MKINISFGYDVIEIEFESDFISDPDTYMNGFDDWYYVVDKINKCYVQNPTFNYNVFDERVILDYLNINFNCNAHVSNVFEQGNEDKSLKYYGF